MPAVAWPNICSPMYGLVFVLSQQLKSCRLQKKHSPQAIGKGTTTRSPTFTLLLSTSGPTSSTTPIGSWPSTSPGFMNGMNPSTRCRSEPQMQVEVIRTMASRRLRIFGSGTRSTDTLYGAHQMSAFIMMSCPSVAGSPRSSEQRTPLVFRVPCALAGAGAVGLADDGRDFAHLHQPLEVPQVFADDTLGVVAEQRRDQVPEAPHRRNVIHTNMDLGAAVLVQPGG